MSRLQELQQLFKQTDSNTSNTAKNTVFEILPKVNEINNISQQDIDKFKELPRFCEHLPFEMKKALIALKKLHNTPYEFASTALLGYANTCMHHLYDVQSYKYGIRPTSLFTMILLGTGGSKSTIHNELKGPIIEYEKRMYDALKNEEARFISEDKKYKKDIKKWEEDRDNGIHNAFPEKPKPIETANYLLEKFTVNGLIDSLRSQSHVSIISAEAGVFFSSHAFQNMKGDLSRATEMTSTLTKLWDGDILSKNISDDLVRLENRRGNIMGLVQAHVVRDILNNKMFQEQGFVHRILICQVEEFEKPNMSFDDETLKQEQLARQDLQPYLNRLTELLNNRPTHVENRDFELKCRVLESSIDSRKLLADFYNETKNLGKDNNKLSRYEGFSNRLHEHALRIAATIAIFNRHSEIEEIDVKCAIDYMNMFIEHRYKMDLGIIDTRPELSQNSVTLLNFFEKNVGKTYTKREIRVYGPNSLRNISDGQFVDMLDDLVSKEEIIAIETVSNNGKKTIKFGILDK